MGIVELLPPDYNKLLAALLILLRTIHGYGAFLGCKVTVECCRAWFPDHTTLLVGFECSAYYLGGSLAIIMGGYAYEAFGYQVPYLFAVAAILTFWVYNFICMPRTSEPVFVKVRNIGGIIESPWSDEIIASEARNKDRVLEKGEEVASPLGISWQVAIPLAALSLTVVLEGFSAAITTPYLNDIYDLPISRGSSYVFVQYIGLMMGAASSGSILQLGWFSASKVMAAASFICVVGVMLVFPGQGIKYLYEGVPQLAYFGLFLQGFGSQMIGVATLPAVEETHTVLGGRPYTNRNKSTASTLWLCAWSMSVYGGHLVALLVMDFMTYSQGGWMLASFSALSLVLCIFQDISIWRSKVASRRAELELSLVKVNKLSGMQSGGSAEGAGSASGIEMIRPNPARLTSNT